MTATQYINFVSYAQDEVNTVFIKLYNDEEYAYGVYFAPKINLKEVDEDMGNLGFYKQI